MVEGPTKVLRVFRALLYTYTMPNHHYTSTYMLAYHHLKFSESLWENETLTHLREEKRQRLAVKVWWRAYKQGLVKHIQCQTTTILAPTCGIPPLDQ